MSMHTKWLSLFLSSVVGIMSLGNSVAVAGDITLYTPYTKISVPPGQSIDYTIQVMNNSSDVKNVNLRIAGLPRGWTSTMKSGAWNVSQISVLPDKKENIALKVQVPLKIKKGWYHFSLEAGGLASLPLTVIVSESDTIVNLAYKYLGNTDQAWTLTHYNQLKKPKLHRGEILLVPLTKLALTDEGKRAAAAAASSTRSETEGRARTEQQRVQLELPALLADIRQGRYVEAVRRGNRFLASGALTKNQLSVVHRQLLEAYAALHASGLAAGACASWRKLDPRAALEPVMTSPKVIAACRRAAAPVDEAPPSSTPKPQANQ